MNESGAPNVYYHSYIPSISRNSYDPSSRQSNTYSVASSINNSCGCSQDEEEIIPSSQPNPSPSRFKESSSCSTNSENKGILDDVNLDESFTSFFEEDTVIYEGDLLLNESEFEKSKRELKERIEKAKRFYFDNWNCQINLNHDSFIRFHRINNFGVGFRYQNRVDGMAEVELLCQLVNERYKIKYICRKLFFRESVLRHDTSTNNKLVSKYIGGSGIVGKFRSELQQEIKEYLWILKIYRERFTYIKNKIIDNMNIDEKVVENIRDYDHVFNYFLKELNKSNINKKNVDCNNNSNIDNDNDEFDDINNNENDCNTYNVQM